MFIKKGVKNALIHRGNRLLKREQLLNGVEKLKLQMVQMPSVIHSMIQNGLFTI